VHGAVRSQRVEEGEQRRLREPAGVEVVARGDPDGVGGLHLVGDVDLRWREVADEHDGEHRRHPGLPAQPLDTGLDLAEDFLGDAPTVEDQEGIRPGR